MQPKKDLETEGYFALRLVSHHATRPVCGLAVLVCFKCPIHDMQEGSRCDSRNMVQSCHTLEVYLVVVALQGFREATGWPGQSGLHSGPENSPAENAFLVRRS